MRKRMTLAAIKKKERFHEPEDPVSEIIYDLKRSERVATLVVEGVVDEEIYKKVRKKIYQELESSVNDGDSRFPDLPHVEIIIAGGKDFVLAVYNEIEKFEKVLPVVFMVDKDKWVYSQIPERYKEDIICTTGYSIENDLYSDGEPRNLIHPDKVLQYDCELSDAIQEWAREVALWKASGCSTTADSLEEKFKEEINDNPELKLRGKTLFDLLFSVCDTRNHLELCMKVLATIDWAQEHPMLLSTLVWNIQNKIVTKQTAISHLISIPSKERP